MKKEIKIITGITVGFILLIPIAFYLFFSYLVWIFNDPFDLFPDNKPPIETPFERLPAYQECVKSGGVPIRSGWNGEVKRCDK